MVSHNLLSRVIERLRQPLFCDDERMSRIAQGRQPSCAFVLSSVFQYPFLTLQGKGLAVDGSGDGEDTIKVIVLVLEQL